MATTTRINAHFLDVQLGVQLYVTDCPSCGVVFAIPNWFDDAKRENGESLYCPNGHSMSYNSERQKREKALKRENERLQAQVENRDARLTRVIADRDHLDRSARALRGHLTRIKNRIANGVCPVAGCKRSGFDDVRRHIHSKHPGWAHEHPEALEAGK